MTQSCLLGITRCVPQETFSLRPRQVHQGHGLYNKFFNNQACSVKMPGSIVGWLEFEYAKKTLANIQPQSRPSNIAWKDQHEQLIISTFFSSSSLSLFFCLQDNDVVEDGTTDTDFVLHTFTSPPKIDAEPCSWTSAGLLIHLLVVRSTVEPLFSTQNLNSPSPTLWRIYLIEV